MLEALAASRYAIGSAAFLDTTEQRLAGRRSGRAQDRDLALPRATLGIERIDEAVAAHYGLAPWDVANCRSGERAAKFIAVELACRLTGLTQRSIGEHYGGITSAAVSNIRRRLRQGRYPYGEVVEELRRRLNAVSS